MLRDAYWWLWRFYGSWVSPHRWFRRARLFWQRGTRGFADEDVWSFDSYLTDIIVQGVAKLRENNIGYPASIIEDDALGVVIDDDRENMDKWKAILSKIIRGFVARKMIADLDYYGGEMVENKVTRQLLARLEAERDEGMALFAKWFDALWD